MTTNTTMATDKEMFAAYLQTKANDYGDSVAKLELSGFEFYSLDNLVSELFSAILHNDPEPVAELDYAIGEFEGLVANLKRVRAGFVAYKAHCEEAV